MAAGSTYTPIATTTLGSAQATVTFSSLGTYTDLLVIVNAIASSGTPYQRLQVNGDTGTNYSRTGLTGTGTGAYSFRDANQSYWGYDGQSALSTTAAQVGILHLMNYSNTSTYKTFIGRNGNANQGVEASVGLWRNTAAITSITLLLSGSTYAAGSTFTLYGIQAA